MGNKIRNKTQIVYSGNYKRMSSNTEIACNFCMCNRLLKSNSSQRREQEIVVNKDTNNESFLLAMISSFQIKEKNWIGERNRLLNEMLWMKEELSAIREFIVNDQTNCEWFSDLTKNYQTPIPAFIRACHVEPENEEKHSSSTKIESFAYTIAKESNVKRKQKVLFISNYETPELEVDTEKNLSAMLNQVHSETKDSSIYK